MERVLTNYQVEWLSNLKLLSDYEDDTFKKDEMANKTRNFIENNYPGDEMKIIEEFEVLHEKGFIKFQGSIDDLIIERIVLTKSGLDYLTILEEDFNEKVVYNEGVSNIYKMLCSIRDNCEKLNEKSLADKIEQYSTITSNILSSSMSLASIGQGIIPLLCKIKF